LDDAVELVRNLKPGDYDAVICRGVTGHMVERSTTTPVVNIEISTPDIIRIAQLASNTLSNYAFVGSKKLISHIQSYYMLIKHECPIHAIESEEDAKVLIRDLKAEGYTYIIGDGIAVDVAKSLGIGNILITSGEESIHTALDRCVEICRRLKHMRESAAMLDAVMSGLDSRVFVYDEQCALVYSNAPAQDRRYQDLAEKLKRRVRSVFELSSARIRDNGPECSWNIEGKLLRLDKSAYCAFYVRALTGRLVRRENELYTTMGFSPERLSENLALYNSSGVMRALIENIRKNGEYSLTVFISGEYGSGKDTLAYTIYALSAYRNNPFVLIDCADAKKKNWSFLLDNYNSPLYANETTIYFKDFSDIPPEVQQDIYGFAKSTSLVKRNRIIVSVLRHPFDEPRVDSFAYKLYQMFDGISIRIPPLRERIDELPSIAACYINEINQQFPTRVIGFDSDAIELLKAHDWPYNIDQLKQVVRELAINATNMYITAEDVRTILSPRHAQAARPSDDLDLSKPLPEIMRDVISLVLKQEDMNQTKAAKRLGISRSSIWRKLQE
ncbi:MAG: sigma-54-dependent Fis family transcriptional regulator, partial [Clostridiales bacterium]|nr:sigma-54-dependent Fis family transcriptional regulator [Clostridiales bacterium]